MGMRARQCLGYGKRHVWDTVVPGARNKEDRVRLAAPPRSRHTLQKLRQTSSEGDAEVLLERTQHARTHSIAASAENPALQ